MFPPAFIVLRQARRATTVGEYRIGRGDMVCIYTYGIHRNGKWFDDPNTFNPQRFLGDHPPSNTVYTPFGLGKRACPAAKFATVATVLMLANVLERFRLEVPEDAPPVEPVLFMGLRPKDGLQLRLVEREAKVQSTSRV